MLAIDVGDLYINVYRVSQKTWTFFESAIAPSFMDETFQNFLCL